MSKKLFLASAGALALIGSAALAAEPLPPPPPPVFTWTGPYIGGQVGYAWGPSAFELIGFNPANRAFFLFTSSNTPNGVIGGAHVGYQYQFNQFVVGVEGSVDGTSLSANARFFAPAFLGNNILTAHATSDVQGSIRGKLGVAWDRLLLYGTGGVAFGGFSSNLFINGPTPFTPPFFVANRFFSNTRVGWTAGGGVEYAVTDNWWVFAEYRYSNFGSFNNTLFNAFAPGAAALGTAFANNTVRQIREHQVQAGFSYRFNLLPPPPVGCQILIFGHPGGLQSKQKPLRYAFACTASARWAGCGFFGRQIETESQFIYSTN
jgi:outer membrane immunogenic protein